MTKPLLLLSYGFYHKNSDTPVHQKIAHLTIDQQLLSKDSKAGRLARKAWLKTFDRHMFQNDLKLAKQGNAKSQYDLAADFIEGIGTTKDAEKAVYWYQESAKQGNVAGQSMLSAIYREGDGVKQDYSKAYYWGQKAANKGDVESQNNLGYMYDFGLGVKQDSVQAAYWYRKAAEQGMALAQGNLAVMLEHGQGVPINVPKAVSWYSKCASNYWLCGFNLAYLYRDGNGVSQDYSKAAYYYQLAANLSSADATNSLYFLYLNGQGVLKDPAKGMAFLKSAADGGSAYGEYNLGKEYYYGTNIGQDIKQSAKYIKLAYQNSDQVVSKKAHDFWDQHQLWNTTNISNPTPHANTINGGVHYTRAYTPPSVKYQPPNTVSVSPYDHTHWVRGYSRSNGTFVQRHLSGNPYSGVHCHKNVCGYR